MTILSTGGVPTQYPAVTIVGADGGAYNPANDIPTGTYPEPPLQNLLAWTADPAMAGSNLSSTLGFMFVHKIWIPRSITVTTMRVNVNVAGGTLTAGQCFAGLYDSSGTRLALTADQSGVWNSTGAKAMALTSSVDIIGGDGVFIWASLLVNGATTASFAGYGGNAFVTNMAVSGATARAAFVPGGGLTALPASFTPSGLSITGLTFVGLS